MSWSSVACIGVTGAVQVSEGEVERLVAKVAGDQLNKDMSLLAGQVTELSKELEELQLRVATPQTSGSSRTPECVVLNRKSIAEGCMRLDSGCWRIHCGWRFSRPGVTLHDNVPEDIPRRCEKCFPAHGGAGFEDGEGPSAGHARLSQPKRFIL
eukprot:243854-Amphidinium_carterae.1